MRRKILLSILPVLLLSELSTLNSTIPMVSAAVSPHIAVVPESSVDPSLTPGMNYTISIYTDYTGDDVNGYGFELTYNASVLEGIEVVNGDLINTTTMFFSVGFNNTAGRLMYTTNNLPFFAKPAPLTSGPGTLANVTFRVVAKGTSNITFEDQGDFRAMLVGYLDGGHGDPYLIIDSETMPDHIQHGFFDNRMHAIAGTVTDALTGHPIPETNVTVTPGEYTATTDADGHYTFTDVPLGTYTVTAEATGYHSNSTSATVFAGNTTTVDFALTPLPGAIAGTVTDASNGDPIVGASVAADGHTATTDADGHYTFTDVPLGTYTVTASATGYESASQHPITVVAGESTTVNFALRVISTVTISADPANITVGNSTTLSGSISPIRGGLNVTIQYKLKDEEVWNNLTIVTTNESGQYSHVWAPETAGTYEVKASWLGDDRTSPAESNVQPTIVQELPSGSPLYPYAVAIVAAGVAATIVAAAFYFLRIRKPETKPPETRLFSIFSS